MEELGTLGIFRLFPCTFLCDCSKLIFTVSQHVKLIILNFKADYRLRAAAILLRYKMKKR